MRYIIKNNPFFYKIWFKFYRNNRGAKIKMINSNTKLLFDGYPRSGNTYALFLIRKIFNREDVAHHFHAVAPIKIALKLDLKIIIIIRHPLDAIASFYLKKFEKKLKVPKEVNVKLMRVMVQDYIAYYSYVEKVKENLFILKFDSLINSPEITMKKIQILMNGYVDDKKESLITENKDKIFGSKSILGSSKPNKEKEKLKDELKIVISKIPKYIFCLEMYNELLEDENIN